MTDSRHTPLHDTHVALGARMIDFGGWRMPVQYKPGIIKEHENVRAAVGLFDVSHMGEAWLRGAGAGAAVQRLVTNDVGKMRDGSAMYTVMCYEHGGIVDDCIVYRQSEDAYMIVLNASNVAKDLAWIEDACKGFEVALEDASDATALIAVQGPRAVALVDRLSQAEMASIRPFHFADTDIAGVRCMAARTGYTGEDGFELACPAEHAVALFSALMDEGQADQVLPIGLGARDTLRLEARLCLYGNDIDETTTPYEAGLGWVVKPDAGDFIGKAALVAQRDRGVKRRLVGFRIDGRGIARAGYDILAPSPRDQPATADSGPGAAPGTAPDATPDAVIGRVTSGGKGISVDAAIGLGYVPVAHAGIGSPLIIDCRGKPASAVIVKGKFYKRETA